MNEIAPLILTARLDPESFRVLDGLRKKHFPPERNFLAAHVTLFHKLPGEHLEDVRSELTAVSSQSGPIPAAYPSVRFLGRGVAIEVDAPRLIQLRRQLADAWAEHLAPQDRQKFRPHVTVQNKVEPQTARELHDTLSVSFELRDGSFTGFQLWHYEGGPWRLEAEFPFSARS